MFSFAKAKGASYDYEIIFKKLMLQLETLDRASESISEILNSILGVVGARSGSLFLHQSSSNLFLLQKWVGDKPLNVSVAGDFEFISYLKQVQTVLFKDEVLKEPRYIDVRAAGIHYFTQLSCVTVVPLFIKSHCLGLLNVGRLIDNRAPSDEERNLLLLLGYWLSHNISNTRLYDEVKTQNKKMAELTHLKNELMSNVTHELRTPLNGIMGLTQLILDGSDGELSVDQSRHLQMIKSAGESLLEIVNNILTLIKVEAGKGDLEVTRLDLSKMIGEVGTLFEGIFKSKENGFKTLVNKEINVYGDEEKIRTVLMNLIGNATKFTQNGQIEVHAVKSGEMARVCVKDTGIGISDEDQLKIFDEFRQADGSVTRAYGGTGLGLAIAKKIVEMHGGRIWVDSIPGKGSEFYFTLPTRPTGIAAAEVG